MSAPSGVSVDLRSLRRLSDGVDRPADERPSGQRHGQRAKPARAGHEQRRRATAGDRGARPGHPPACEVAIAVAEPRRAADDEALQAAAGVDVHADQRRQTPPAEPLHRRADDAAAQRRRRRRGRSSVAIVRWLPPPTGRRRRPRRRRPRSIRQ